MSAPFTNITERDFSSVTPPITGLAGAIVLPAIRGPVNTPVFISSKAQFRNVFTRYQKMESGFDMGYWSAETFLATSSQLWVVRAANAALYGGMVAQKAGIETVANRSYSAGAGMTIAIALDVITVTPVAGGTGYAVGDRATLVDTGGIATTIAIVEVVAETAGVVDTVVEVVAGVGYSDGTEATVNISAGQSDPVTNYATTPGFGTNDVFTLFSADPGAWDNDIGVRLYPYRAEESLATTDFTIDTANTIDVTQQWALGEEVKLMNDPANATATTFVGTVAGVADTNLLNTTFYVAEYLEPAANTIQLASTQALGLAGTPDITFAVAPDFAVILAPVVQRCQEPNAFNIEVYQLQADGTDKLVEGPHTVSRLSTATDGYGKNIFMETYLANKSLFIKGVNNVLVDEVTNPYPQAQFTTLRFSQGSNGSAVTEGNMVTSANKLSNQDSYKYKVFMDAGYATATYSQTLVDICSSRQDSEAILSVPRDVEETTTPVTDVINYRNNTLAIDNSFGALYSPHLIVYDADLDDEVYVSPDGFAAAAISATYTNFKPWYPVAGHTRGVLNRLTPVKDVSVRYDDDGSGGSDVGALYDAGINPIKFISGTGPIIWGQKTLSIRPSARDRLNVRLLLNEVEPVIKDTLKYYLMELSDEATRGVIVAVLRSYLESIKSSRGLYGYAVICDDTNNSDLDVANNTLNVAVLLQPTYAVEYIPVTLGIVSYGTDFKIIQEQL